MRAAQYLVNTESGALSTSRPGGVLWPRVVSPFLRIIITHTDNYDAAAERSMKGKLKVNWTDTYVDTSHIGLLQFGSRDYVSNGWGMQRKDSPHEPDQDIRQRDGAARCPLTAKAQTLLGFDARYGRVRDQLRLLLSWESWGHGTRDTMAAGWPSAILSPSNTHSFFSTAMSGPEKPPPPNASRTGSWRNPSTEDLVLFKLSNRVRGTGKVGEIGTLLAEAFERIVQAAGRGRRAILISTKAIHWALRAPRSTAITKTRWP